MRGTIPSQVTHLTALEVIQLQNTSLSGLMPAGLSNLSVLQELRVAYTTMSGSIPSSLCDTKVFELSVRNASRVSSTVPECTGLENFDDTNIFQFGETQMS